jgi:hypothetical protein
VVLGWDVVVVVVRGNVVETELVVVAIVAVVSRVSATVRGGVVDVDVVSVTTSALQAAIARMSTRPREACLIVRLLRRFSARRLLIVLSCHEDISSLTPNICSI